MAEIKRILCLTDRKELNIGGVKEVISFDDNGAVILTENGELSVEGENIRISNLDAQSGEVNITGKIDAMIYSADSNEKKKGIRARLFG
ncbi:MAG: sporulation protein YabP [Clostridia bacterium]|nr:sporulation protein YabP [Clostridia bacterium]